jgi:hypothetical protein
MRKAPALAALVLAFGGAAAMSAPADAQSITFTLGGGSLSISEPGAAALTAGALSGLAGSAFTGSLGNTTVTDQRGGVAGWSTTIAQTTAFSDGSTTIPVGNTKVWVAAPIVPTGVAVVAAGTYLTQVTGLALTSSGQAFVSATAVVGNNAATFNPSLAVTVPSNATAGTYSGVVTQTVS